MAKTSANQAVIVIALVALAAAAGGAALWFRAAPAPERPSVPAPSAPATAPVAPAPTDATPATDAAVKTTFASDHLDAKQRSELELIGRLSDELKLSQAERSAIEAALTKLQAGRREQFARLVAESADEAAITSGLLAHHRAFEEDLTKALGASRATAFKDRFNAAYGLTFKQKKP